MSEPALAFWLLLLGPCVGSFLGTFSERFCRGGSMLVQSRCRACGTRLTWRDLVPVASWIAIRGRCRHCGARLDPTLLAVEVGGSLLALVAILAAGNPIAEITGAVWLWCLMGLFLTDRVCLRLPDALTGALLVSGLALGAEGTMSGLVTSLAAALVGATVLWGLALLYRQLRGREGLGLGDVKMIAGIGAAVGPAGLPWVTLFAAAGTLAVALLRAEAEVQFDSARPEPFGCALALSAALVWLLQGALYSW